MDAQTILSMVKQKLFEPRKRVVSDVLGNKTLECAVRPVPIGLTGRDKELFEAADGWNVADKDYVDWKIGEIKGGPSAGARFLQAHVSVAATEEGVATFFGPGILLKKDCVLEEFSLVFSSPCLEECTLHMKLSSDPSGKALMSQKIKTGSPVLVAEPRFKMENNAAVLFQLKFSKKTVTHDAISLQITTS